jgi:DNA polymerase elongation subunit (family B)
MTTKNNLQTKRRRLYFDLECSPNIGFFWTAGYKLNISTESIIKERAIICICYKWEDEEETHSVYWDSKQNDKKLLIEFIKVANQANELVGHNGDKFDLAWIRTRCLFHRIEMFPTYVTIDTLKVARSKFKFNSNKLNYIAQYLGIGEKIHTEYNLWKDIVLNKCKDSMEKMIKYCKQDVILLEKVHKELNHHIPAKTHYGVLFGEDRGTCPECGSDDLARNNKVVTATGLTRIQYRCNTCHKYHSKTDK